MIRLLFPLFLPWLALSFLVAEEPRVVRDIEYARVGERILKLDLHLPAQAAGPLVVYVHGGAWRGGSKDDMPLGDLVRQGIPVASVDYRLSPEARFPAQVHDIKAAIRFLRARQGELDIDAGRIVVAGSSAGGHLAALVGVSNGLTALEGAVGGETSQSSAVQGIVSFFGASNLETILAQSTPHGVKMRVPALELLLGSLPTKVPDLARLASPVRHVDAQDPPLFLLHGDQDPQMPVNQSLELQAVYEAAGAPVTFLNVHGAAHGGAAFYDAARLGRVLDFLQKLPANP
ncbi:MAG: alpha/beta fold hydrolase [Verrucomicrobiales bacterium]